MIPLAFDMYFAASLLCLLDPVSELTSFTDLFSTFREHPGSFRHTRDFNRGTIQDLFLRF